ncbi:MULTISPECIES: hypothetical protein [Bradyrhizobium]|uniref:Uncharacterized protein n=2 Tax=Bradyrhizobium ottawaense TaxID=931866 RepID=A0ABV4FK84_9BRAD|nr:MULTISPECIES: hypothetical protein [Bradyrhizobium]MBR1294782.1 hypothetical protein [Bradyrhizobium ottawaense]MDA9486364.1 hypothetical protein [Bradyrhizobium sp. CCBAU 11445]WLB44737.1 hypothetical protein QIH93_30050 [Bradyrhizobium ottawaense]WQN82035.1 hypothetical protein U7859_34515 [Bradyrhizobium ottawaense]BBO03341.1 hypothetical protein SG09_26910 [Bradyrhizobium ottawaense]
MMLSDHLTSSMEVALEETCRELPNGGDHESRKVIDEQLLAAAEAGHITLDKLRAAALRGFPSEAKAARE